MKYFYFAGVGSKPSDFATALAKGYPLHKGWFRVIRKQGILETIELDFLPSFEIASEMASARNLA